MLQKHELKRQTQQLGHLAPRPSYGLPLRRNLFATLSHNSFQRQTNKQTTFLWRPGTRVEVFNCIAKQCFWGSSLPSTVLVLVCCYTCRFLTSPSLTCPPSLPASQPSLNHLLLLPSKVCPSSFLSPHFIHSVPPRFNNTLRPPPLSIFRPLLMCTPRRKPPPTP